MSGEKPASRAADYFDGDAPVVGAVEAEALQHGVELAEFVLGKVEFGNVGDAAIRRDDGDLHRRLMRLAFSARVIK